MQTKTKTIPEEDLIPLLQSIKKPKLQTYASLLYWLAARAGELLPYTHYKTKYKRDENNKLLTNNKGHCIVESRTIDYTTQGIPISTIKMFDNYIEFTEIPVFKSKNKNKTKAGFVPKKDNLLFENITSYILERKAIQAKYNTEAVNSDSPPVTVYLFSCELEDEDNLHFFWKFKKQLDVIMRKKGFTSHSLRKTRLSKAGNDSGDPYFVQALSGHASINMASEYVAKRKLFDSLKKYEGI